jgi:alkylation response protein AidB-like acyl-CoA dehydrogenase
METYVELDLGFSTEHQQLRDTVHRFARDVLRPAAARLDRLADPQDVIAPRSELWGVLRQGYALGYHAASMPAELGGLGLRGLGMHVFLEEMGWGSVDLGISLGVASFPFGMLAATGDKELIEQFVKPFIDDKEARFIGCWPVTEPQHGSDWAAEALGIQDPSLAGRALVRRDGDSYVIKGQKAAWVSNGTIATHGLTFLTTDTGHGMPPGHAIAFVPFDLPGVSKGKPLNKLGQRALNQGEIFFDDVRIPSRYMLMSPDKPQVGEGFTLAGPNGSMGAMFTGVARAAFEAALDYSKQRIQGGKPICEHQLVQRRLFDMFTKVEACRQLSRAAMIYNTSAVGVEYAIASKTYCTQAAFEVANDAVQLFGGNGLSKEYPVEKILRDTRAALIEDGTNDVLSLVGANLVLARS